MDRIANSLFGNWRHLIEDPVLVNDVKHAVEKGSVPSFGFFFMLAAAGVIATFGLLSNSAAVIIGAMIVAPLIYNGMFALTAGKDALFYLPGSPFIVAAAMSGLALMLYALRTPAPEVIQPPPH